MTASFHPAIESLCRGDHLSEEEAHRIFTSVMRGDVSEPQLTAILVALKAKGETPAEIAGAARAMREAAHTLDTGDLEVVDSCGTGGDGAQTVNISTAAALVAAEAGLCVAKHGNRSISSRCGSADVLEALGIDIRAPAAASRRALTHARICFLFAPQYHPGVGHAMPVRRALKVRTLFNLLGPLVNPALPDCQLVGVYDPARCVPLARTLGLLGVHRAMVVHGGGLDEVALHAPTTAAWLDHGEVRELTLRPEDAGLSERGIDELAGGDPEGNAAWLAALLEGKGSDAHNEAVAINTGALLWVAGAAGNLRAGTEHALSILRSGATANRLALWRDQLQTDD